MASVCNVLARIEANPDAISHAYCSRVRVRVRVRVTRAAAGLTPDKPLGLVAAGNGIGK